MVISSIRRHRFGHDLIVTNRLIIMSFILVRCFRLPCIRLMTTMPLVWLPIRNLAGEVEAFPTGSDSSIAL